MLKFHHIQREVFSSVSFGVCFVSTFQFLFYPSIRMLGSKKLGCDTTGRMKGEKEKGDCVKMVANNADEEMLSRDMYIIGH